MISKPYNFDDLIRVMKALRTPKTGCPWDLEQDFDSIIPYTIEEVYEVADAIDRKDMPNLREELGDLLLQPVYHAQMASEDNHFSIDDVVHDITEKMIRRHPHVFGNQDASSPSDVNEIWDKAKKAEKSSKNQSLLDDVLKTLPPLHRSHKIQKKVAKVGFEWPDTQSVLDKLDEEILELKDAHATNEIEHIQDEIGDVLFVLVNYARMQGLNASDVMRKANAKFERRFRAVENTMNKPLEDASLEEMEAAWQHIKKEEKQG